MISYSLKDLDFRFSIFYVLLITLLEDKWSVFISLIYYNFVIGEYRGERSGLWHGGRP